MLDLVRPKFTLPDDSRVSINQYRNPYLSKLTIKILPPYSKIKGATLISPLQNHNNVAIVQSLPLWRNEKFRIGLLWQQNIRTTFNRSHLGFIAEYQMRNNYLLKTKNLVGHSFITSNEVSKTFAHSGRLFTVSGFHSCLFQANSQYFHTVGAGLCVDNKLSIAMNKRIGAQTSLKIHYEKPLKNDMFFRAKYQTDIQKFDQSVGQIGFGYYWSKNSSVWLRTAAQSDKVEPNIAVEMEYKNENKQCFLGSVQFRNQKSIIYVGYKCPSFNFIFPIFGIDSVVPTLIGIGLYLVGYFKRRRTESKKNQSKAALKQKNRYDEIKLISDKANQNYSKEQAHHGLLIQEVYVGQKKLLDQFLAEDNKHIKLMRSEEYMNQIFDGTVSFRFYVQKSQLHLPKGSKLSMIGFFYRSEQAEEIQIYVRYIKNNKQYIKRFKQADEIQL